MMMKLLSLRPAPVLLGVLAFILAGCGSTSRSGSAYSTPSAGSRDSNSAQALTMRAAEIMHEDPEKAEKLLCEALSVDLWHGPAHNNLGVSYLRQGKYYEAANEFEWAGKLMPGHPDPRMNLALTLEKAGRIDEALTTYSTALEVYSHHIPTMQAITRLQLKHNRSDERTSEMLKEIAMAGETHEWRAWAQAKLIGLDNR